MRNVGDPPDPVQQFTDVSRETRLIAHACAPDLCSPGRALVESNSYQALVSSLSSNFQFYRLALHEESPDIGCRGANRYVYFW